ncbi:glycine cleavage system aminomethyltransferase GcvT [Desulfonatronovibrio hydrogenovorans]|uniref:glycine cleavage system aminomethyltransferase GcvT n=1 Tax=Desulfonatronovibrio hydrogenovorans TaxID=53245 RepID=UPI00048DA2B4|nr:glycine cleavage system aminomethyltransferase GcvT [Desulfonatronovibrio hydrogenovorans]
MAHIHHTPIFEIHQQLGARTAPFAGWEMPIQYQGIIAEHQHTRTLAGLFDTCHMGEFMVSGPGAREELGRLVTHDLENTPPGRCVYGFILSGQGTIQDDLIIYPLEQDKFMLVVNASRKQNDFVHLKSNLSSAVRITDLTMQTGKLDLQGPASLNVLEKATGQNWKDLRFFCFRKTMMAGMEILVSRTGYTGELGYELYIPWEGTAGIWDLLLKIESVKPAGLGARDTLRLEAGLPLYGQDLDQQHTPAEAGYESVLKSQSRYLGREKAHHVQERLTGLVIQGRRTPRKGDLVLADGQQAGIITSGSFAPSLGHCIALAYISKEYVSRDRFFIQKDRICLEAEKSALPFYKGTARIKTDQ